MSICALAFVVAAMAAPMRTALANPDADLYTITVESVDSNDKPIKGYVYEVKDAHGAVVAVFDFTSGTVFSKSVKVPAGTYVVTELAHPDQYLPAERPITVTFPSKDPQGKDMKAITITPKHQESVPQEPTKPNKPEKPRKPEVPRYVPKTSDELTSFATAGLLACAGAGLVALSSRNRSEGGVR